MNIRQQTNVRTDMTEESIINNGFPFHPNSFIFYHCDQVVAYGETDVIVIANVKEDIKRNISVLIIGTQHEDKIDSYMEFDSLLQTDPYRLHLIAQKLDNPNSNTINKFPSSCLIITSKGEIEKIVFNIESPKRKLELIK